MAQVDFSRGFHEHLRPKNKTRIPAMNVCDFIPGLLPRQPSDRQFLRAVLGNPAEVIVPAWVDWTSQLLTASDQGQLPHCAAEAVCGLIEFDNWRTRHVYQQLDQIPLYRRAKEIDGMPTTSGTTLASALQAAQDIGYMQPLGADRIRNVATASEMEQALHSYGPVITAFQITDQWFNVGGDGWITSGGNRIGGHAVITAGYEKSEAVPYFIIANSWGRRVGWDGMMRMTYEVFNEQFDGGLCIAPPGTL
jgi:hypothetical protein